MYGREGVVRVLFFMGLIIMVTGIAITSWTFQSLGGLISLSPGGPGFELGPGESLYERGYAYYMDITEIKITFALHPLMHYTFNITKIGGNWTYTKSGSGHDIVSVKLPSRGVYEWNILVWVSEHAKGKLKGSIIESTNTYADSKRYLHIGLYLTISGSVLIFSAFLLGGVRRVL